MAPSPPDITSTHTDADVARPRSSKKLQKKHKEEPNRRRTMELPNHLRDADDAGEEDIIAANGRPNGMFMHMNQSIFDVFSAARSTANIHGRFEDQSSDEEDEDEGGAEVRDSSRSSSQPEAKGKETETHIDPLSRSRIFKKSASDKSSPSDKEGDKKHRRRISSNLLRSLPQLSRLGSLSRSKSSKSSKSKKQAVDEYSPDESSSPTRRYSDPESSESDAGTPKLAPVMSRILEARDEMSARPSFDLERLSSDLRRTALSDDSGDDGPTKLQLALKEIFELDQAEEVIGEYPCWLLLSVLVDGYMYITSKHICFWAYLSKKADKVTKDGYMAKCGKRTSKYTRYWFRLKGDTLSYYHDASNLYYPHGQVDLRYGISAEITDKGKEGVNFSVTTNHRTYYFRADSASSAKEWVKSLQRVIFRSHNDGDTVKISLPIANIMDVEETNMDNLGFADTVKIRVIDNDETFAIDEYFFSFFNSGEAAIRLLKLLVGDSTDSDNESAATGPLRVPKKRRDDTAKPSSRHSSSSRNKSRMESSQVLSPRHREPVKATLSPLSPTMPRENTIRASGDHGRISFDAMKKFDRRSLDMDTIGRDHSPRRSFSGQRVVSSSYGKQAEAQSDNHEESDSFAQSTDDPSLSNMIASSNEDPSASQILQGSEVFHKPTLHRRSTSVSRRSQQENVRSGKSRTKHDEAYPHPKHAATTGHVVDPGSGEGQAGQTPTLQNIAKMGAYPLQRAGHFAGYLNRTSRQMGNLLATESMGYVEKVSGMWKGGRKHYEQSTALNPEDSFQDDEDEADVKAANERFHSHFLLPESDKLQATYFCHMLNVLPLYGKIYLSQRHFCFRSLLPGTRKKLILPLAHIETVDKEKGFRFGYQGLVVIIRGHEELFFEFAQPVVRDDCAVSVLQNLDRSRFIRESQYFDSADMKKANDALAEREALNAARLKEFPDQDQLPHQLTMLNDGDGPTILFDDAKDSLVHFQPTKSMKITCLTIGSRGDVQPYIALCKGLIAEGHKAKIATHAEFRGWIEGHGIEFAPVAGDPADLMKLVIEHGTFSYGFFKEATSSFRPWLDGLLESAWEACKGTDILIESPSAMAGIHIAEALYIPYFRAFTMPWTRTRAYPHAFMTADRNMGGFFNYLSYGLFDNTMWQLSSRQINKWRAKFLNLPATSLDKMQPNKVPFVYNFSPSVVAPPIEYTDWINVSGYWFLDEGKNWTPPDDLREFIEKARADGKKLVYIGFGSIIVPDVAKMTQEVIDAVLGADVRAVLSKGWSDRGAKEKGLEAGIDPLDLPKEPELPPEIFQISSAPHDWLFSQMDAAAHHGGSGTTGASLRAGVPTIVRPFFGDQFFYGLRVEHLGVGICMKKWGAISFAKALWKATHDDRMISKAKVLGQSIQQENGVENAIQFIYSKLEYARSISTEKSKMRKPVASSATGPTEHSDGPELYDDDDVEESWTFVAGDDFDPDIVKKQVISQTEAGAVTDGQKADLGSRQGSNPAKAGSVAS
ncbi:glycosyltransferase family 28 domain-containing protein [Apiospora rasikravindrae]|uniref:sterol 3beta-glucosyltransferase n=1 Tax=Apiospora rasikravindrae TaxID=990691 RepID=A0ABR1TCD4_9PEZI